MDTKKMKRELETRLQQENRSIQYDREKETIRIENKETGKGITVSLASAVSKWHEQQEKAINEVVYYVEEALGVMGKDQRMAGNEKKIFPVIRSTSFPQQSSDGNNFITDEHTAETRIYYALDLGNTYRLVDEELLQKEGWDQDKIREIARFNLRSLSTEMKKDTVAGNDFYFLNTNDGYDASRILNDRFLKETSEKIKGEMAIAVPHQDVLIICDIQNETGYDILAQMTMSFFTNGHVPITALSFMYEDGELEPIFIMAKNRRNK
ncbi:DUF1444 domain-containing protein [Bacillus sp. FJAT-49736]|uniref:DUF1444 domain-containing protein n=1 Tax=Bacillus sp. FJAT-49736 TaxID=2833582 RepID=UPI001BCA2943|nr:DUF1444 domain-containing protein [Bacillus sp. FJAT-49736]MBS4173854.1 DUF1444 domain-containing protein [Bacillus sp. FJAT-49736]